MEMQFFSINPNCIRVCVDTDCPDLTGTAFTPLSDTPVLFNSLADFMLGIDCVFDRAGYPQAFEEKRSFATVEEKKGSYHGIPKLNDNQSKIESQFGRKYTLDLYVESRRKANWQGRLYLVTNSVNDRELLGCFESEMGLLKILDSINKK